MSNDSALCDILWHFFTADPSDHPALLSAATSHLLSLSPTVAGQQLLYQLPSLRFTSLMLLPLVLACEQAAILLALMLEMGRECSSTTNQMDLRDYCGRTPLHHFACYCPDLSLVNMVVLEHPPALLVRSITADGGRTPLQLAASLDAVHGKGNPDVAVLLSATAAALAASNYVEIERVCGGSSPYLDRELAKQAIDVRVAVAICLNRQEAAPTPLASPETGVALALLGRVRDFGRARYSSDLLRRVLEYVGQYVE